MNDTQKDALERSFHVWMHGGVVSKEQVELLVSAATQALDFLIEYEMLPTAEEIQEEVTHHLDQWQANWERRVQAHSMRAILTMALKPFKEVEKPDGPTIRSMG